MKKYPIDKKKMENNNNKIKYNNFSKINNQQNEDDLPSLEEINEKYYNNNNNLNNNSINLFEENNINFDEDDTDENIHINFPRNHLEPFSKSRFNNSNINIGNNINSINFNNNHHNYNNNKNNINININPSNQINRINSRSQSYLDKNGNIIYKSNSNRIININENEPNLIRIDSSRIKVGNNEFEDLTKEAREIQNKEAFEKKILGITKEKLPQDTIKKPLLERIGDFFSEHEEGLTAILDGIGCILLHGPSIGRTIDRIGNWIDGWGEEEPNNINNMEHIGNERRIILEKNKDYGTIMKFLPIWEVRENKKNNNNNNCVICLYEFQIGDKIAALPCLHIFHFDCIKNWLKNELSCPVCKFEVTLSSIIGENNN